MIITENLREALEAKRMTQAELARRVGVSPAAIQQLLNGSSKTSRSIRDIARELDVTVEWLEGDVFDPKAEIRSQGVDPSDFDIVTLPYTKIVRSSAQSEKIGISWVSIGKNWLKAISSGVDPRRLTVASIEDTAMSPTILPGDDVMLRYQSEYDGDPDAIWVFLYNRTTFFRRIRPGADGWVSVDADNPMVASFQAKLSDISIELKAIWIGRRISHS